MLMSELHGCSLAGSQQGDINIITHCTVSGDQALITSSNGAITGIIAMQKSCRDYQL